MRKPIKRSFGMVCGGGPGIDVSDGVHVPQGEGAVSGIFQHLHPIHLNGWNDVVFEKSIRFVCENLIIFPYGQYIVGIYV